MVANAYLLTGASFKGSAFHSANYRGVNVRGDVHFVHALSNSLLMPTCDNFEEMDCYCTGKYAERNKLINPAARGIHPINVYFRYLTYYLVVVTMGCLESVFMTHVSKLLNLIPSASIGMSSLNVG